MNRYSNLGGNSNVQSYEIGDDHIRVWFKGGAKVYTYSFRKAGRYHVNTMKTLARSGQGLNSYIMRNVKLLYD